MHPIGDAIGVLGSRHGLILDPARRSVGVLRFDRFEEAPRVRLRAGVVIGGRERVFPLGDGDCFGFLDQRIGIAADRLIGIDPESAVKVSLTIAAPFRPRDRDFSTTPMVVLQLDARRLLGSFRWQRATIADTEAELFLEVVGVEATPSGDDAIDLAFASARRTGGWGEAETRDDLPQRDRLVGHDGERRGTRFVRRIRLDDSAQQPLTVSWCAWSDPVLEVDGVRRPFVYAARLPSLAAVAAWARSGYGEVLANAERVQRVVESGDLPKAALNLMATTLHAWIACSWWTERGDRDWFSVWEGSCYFHSTVDVEFTQSPFYLALWPELLGLELDAWPAYAVPGDELLGERGRGTAFLSHDVGIHARVGRQCYPHHMHVEETANYLILAHAWHRRTGDGALLVKHQATIRAFVAFLAACDTTGDGVPDRGVANTIDDGSPAVQYGQHQTYLAVKTLAAMVSSTGIAEHLGDRELAERCRARADLLRRTIETHGWAGDHYRVLLRPGGTITNPWTKRTETLETIPGWDVEHIYTANALPPLDMVGVDIGLDPERLRADLRNATRACLREYGCTHSNFRNTDAVTDEQFKQLGLAGVSESSGWIAMNLSRDLAACARGIDLRHLCERYWEWQLATNTHETSLFFETFSGNNLCFYPRGVAVWGLPDAIAGLVVDRVAGIDRASHPLPGVRVPRLDTADWRAGTCTVL